MAKCTTVMAALSILIGIGSPSAVAAPSPFTIDVVGSDVSCTSWRGEPVEILYDRDAVTLGKAYVANDGRPVISINPGALSAYDPMVQQWWVAHECAHHQLPPSINSEARADCVAARKLRQMLRANPRYAANALATELQSLPGSDNGHLPGPQRAKLVLKCAGLERFG